MTESEAWSNWIASIGTMLAVFVALGGYWFSEWQRDKDRKAANLEHALQIGFKLTVLHSDAKHIHNHLFQNATMDELRESSLLWRRLQPELSMEVLTGPQLNAAEQNLLISLLEAELLMRMTESSSRNLVIRKAMAEYRLKREALQEKIPTPIEFHGNVGVFELTGSDNLKLSPYTSVLESLVLQMRRLAILNINETKNLAKLYEKMMKKHFHNAKFILPTD